MGSTGIQLIYRDKKYISFFPMAMKDYGMIAPLHGISSEDSEIRGKNLVYIVHGGQILGALLQMGPTTWNGCVKLAQ